MKVLKMKRCHNCGCSGQLKYKCKKGGVNRRYYVECSECWTSTEKHPSKEAAISEWNNLQPTRKETNSDTLRGTSDAELASILANIQLMEPQDEEFWEDWLAKESELQEVMK